ncbi:SEC-C domain-containing protein [Pseudomonas sp. 8BK]|uniref:SEC-C domain-containing protein n=1 Tax=Pseudomonas sp. 8BK TaxID=2653164 RepID=UPI0013578B2F|nr:SEC-C domain-containing protein [Pseudomonas sp. 8BK]
MSKLFTHPHINEIFLHIKNITTQAVVDINALEFESAITSLLSAKNHISEARYKHEDKEEDYLNALWVLDRFIELFEDYCQLWLAITSGRFSQSWVNLQDCLSNLRNIKRFSKITIEQLEEQLLQLEQAYPYKIFASIGAIVDHFECSVCGKNIDSFDCPHMQGQLYGGEMAVAIAKEVTRLDHVALVKNPRDKRCVITLDDSDPGFSIINYIGELIDNKTCNIIGFSKLIFSKRLIPNPNYQHKDRNEICFCGSGIKFKKCCINTRIVSKDHVDVMGTTRTANQLLS